MNEIHLDLIADGRPSRSILLWGYAASMVALGGYYIMSGGYLLGSLAVSLGMFSYFVDLTRRASWREGYISAVQSIASQMDDSELERIR